MWPSESTCARKPATGQQSVRVYSTLAPNLLICSLSDYGFVCGKDFTDHIGPVKSFSLPQDVAPDDQGIWELGACGLKAKRSINRLKILTNKNAYVVESEHPFELLVRCASRKHREALHKLLHNAQHKRALIAHIGRGLSNKWICSKASKFYE